MARLRRHLAAAQAAAAAERTRRLPGAGGDLAGPAAVAAVETRAADWAQVRPEWALARNAGFIVGHRSLTREIDLDGRCFLHSYDWRADEDGTFLEVILTAPMVVAEWINTQYFFSTVDNAVYGAGSKDHPHRRRRRRRDAGQRQRPDDRPAAAVGDERGAARPIMSRCG